MTNRTDKEIRDSVLSNMRLEGIDLTKEETETIKYLDELGFRIREINDVLKEIEKHDK